MKMSTIVNQDFENAKKCFEEELEQIISSGILPVDVQTSAADKTITAESLRSEFDHCLNEMFTIAVCGEVKAGKSTLLNSLIFEDEVLPSFVTPETAKLTFVRESKKEKDYFTVNWYSKSEWDEMKRSLPEENRKVLDERLEYSVSKGVTQFNCVGKNPVDVDDLKRLAEYTSVPKEGEQNPNVGVYTPFVKNVEIYIKSDKLKNLQIVDTPGLNDPNRINSNETTKWINQAHAIIYVFPVRGLGSSDLEFFKTFMPAKTLKTRILVQNRIDENKDYKHATAEYSNEPAYQAVGLFVPGEVLCSYSAQVNLSQKKKEKDKASARDEKFLRKYPDLDSDPDKLAEKVSSRLYANSGYARIESLSNICCSVYSGKMKKIQESINLLKFKLDQFERPLEQVKDKLKIIRNDKADINHELEEIKKKLNESVDDFESNIKDRLLAEWRNLNFQPEIERLVSKSGGYHNVKGEFPDIWDLKMREIKNGLEKYIRSGVREIQEKVSKKQDSIVQKISAVMHENVRGIIVDYSKEKWGVDIDSDLKDLGLPSGFWDNLITRGSVVAANITTAVNKQIVDIRKKYDPYSKIVAQRVSALIKKTFEEISKKMDYIENTLQEVLDKEKNLNDEKALLEKEIQNEKNMEARCTKKIEDIKGLVKKLA